MKLRLPVLFLAAVLAAYSSFSVLAQEAFAVDGSLIISSGDYTENVYTGGTSNLDGNTSLTISGGTFTQSVFGGGLNSSVLGNVTINISSFGGDNIYGGAHASGTSASDEINIFVGDVVMNISMAQSDSSAIGGDIFGGGMSYSYTSTSSVTNTTKSVTMTISAGLFNGMVFGGGEAMGTYSNSAVSKAIVSGGTSLSILGGTFSEAIFGGGKARISGDQYGTAISSTGDTKLSVEGGVLTGVIGGGWAVIHMDANGSKPNQFLYAEAVSGNTLINISGGTINRLGSSSGTSIEIMDKTYNMAVVGGGAAIGGGITEGCSTSVSVASTSINISGGTINGDVVGGGLSSAQLRGNYYSSGGTSTVAGDVKINITGGTIAGFVFGGGVALGGTHQNAEYSGGTSAVGNVSLRVEGTRGSSISIERIYGAGSAIGANSVSSTGDISVYLGANTNITGSIYGGGRISDGGAMSSGKIETTLDSVHYENTYGYDGGVIFGGCNIAATKQGAFITTGLVSGGITLNIIGNTQILMGENWNADIHAGGRALNLGSTLTVQGGVKTYIAGTVNIEGSVYGGTRAAFSDGGTKYGAVSSVTGGTLVLISGGTIADMVIGGGSASGSGTTTIDFSQVVISGGKIGGTGYPDDNFEGVFGGTFSQQNGYTMLGVQGGTTLVSSVDISGAAEITGNVFAGSYTQNATGRTGTNPTIMGTDIYGNTSVVISGGTIKASNYNDVQFGGSVYGGSMASKWGSPSISAGNKSSARASIEGNTSVVVNGGTIQGDVYGGSLAIHRADTKNSNVSASSTCVATITGDTNIQIGGYAVILGSVYAGGHTAIENFDPTLSAEDYVFSTIQGSAHIALTGNNWVIGQDICGTGLGVNTGIAKGSDLNISGYQGVAGAAKQWKNSVKDFTTVSFGAGTNIVGLVSGVVFTGNGTLALIDGAKFTSYAGLGDMSHTALSISGSGSEMVLGQTILGNLTVGEGSKFHVGLTGTLAGGSTILTSEEAFAVSNLKIDASSQLSQFEKNTYTLVDGALSLADGFTINGLGVTNGTGTYKKDGKMLSYTISGNQITFGDIVDIAPPSPPPVGGSTEITTDVSIVEGQTETAAEGEIHFTPDGTQSPIQIGSGVDLNAGAGATVSQVVVTTTTTTFDEKGNAIDQEVSTTGTQTLLSITGEASLTGSGDSPAHLATDLVQVGAGANVNLNGLTLKTSKKEGSALEVANAKVVLENAHIDGEGSQALSINSVIQGSGSVKNMSVVNGSLRAGNSPGVMELSNITTGVLSGAYGQGNNMVFQAQICNFGDNITLDGMNNDTGATGNISQFNITGDVVLGSGTVFEIVLWNDGNVGDLDTKTLESGAKFQFFTFNGGSITGEFAGMLNAPVLADGLMWDISQLTTGGFAQVIWSSIADGSRIANTLWTSGQTVANISTEAVKHVGEAVTGKTTVWLSSLNDFTRANSAGSTTGYDFNTQGYSVGAQRGIEGGHVIGLAFGNSYGTHTPLQESTHASAGKIKQDAVMGTVYGRVMLSKATATDKIWSIDAYAGYGEVSNKSDRTVNYDSSNAHAKWDDMVKTLGVQANYAKKLNERTIVTPFVGLDFIHGEQDSFTEYAKSVKASYDNGAYYNLRASLGAGISHVVEFSNGMALIPSLSASYGYDICRMNPHTDVSEAAGNYRAYGVNPGRNSFQITPALSWKINKGWSASTNYTLRTRSGLTDQSVNASVSYTF